MIDAIGGYREEAFVHALNYLRSNNIDGAIVELGVFRGESLAMLARLSRGERRIVGVDSFDGLPAPGEYDSAQFSRGALQATIAEARAHLGSYPAALIAGWFRDLPPFTVPIAFVHLDCDLYDSARDGLALVEDAIVDGAIVCIDDYYCHRARPDLGVRRAWSEWLKATGRTATWFWRYGWHGLAFVVHENGGEGT